MDVKLLEIDSKNGKLKLSRKQLLPKPEGYQESRRREKGDKPQRDYRNNRDHRPKGGILITVVSDRIARQEVNVFN